jgi:phenylalanyl-tRNA synthetase alpha chain
MPALLSAEQLGHDLSIRDLTDPASGQHAIQLVLGGAVRAIRGRWPDRPRWRRGDRIVPVTDNYDLLGYDPADVTREARYSRYVATGWMLRSHSTALIPGALRWLAALPDDGALLVCPGLVYRRDAIDRLHTGTPHQLDLWRLTRRSPALAASDLQDMIEALLGGLLPGAPYRLDERVHPYTLGGCQIDVYHDGEWVEIGEAGLAHPDVLRRAGLGGAWTGLAVGLGLDRILMLMKAIPDIRLLRSADPRVAAQMRDLDGYRAVSVMPPVSRDLSVAVPAGDLAEDLGDRVRDALGADADCVESVQILARTPCAELPAPALDRLGARPEQDNLLVRVVLRALDRTLTGPEANLLRDRVYAAIHRGSVYQWSAAGGGWDNGPAVAAAPPDRMGA